MEISFSIIIPVYNRPDEIDELLQSIVDQQYKEDLEVIIVEDGSDIRSEHIAEKYTSILNVKYFHKSNSGPGQSRNYGMQNAMGNYFIILDSDVILPKHYLKTVRASLESNYTEAYGGPDAALPDFTPVQKGINAAMTSFLTTGGLRGSETKEEKFQLRSFNLGLSKKAFQKTGGFSKQHYGEDIDLTFRLWENHLSTRFIANAFVYHKRRTSFKQFFHQTFNFGAARPVLNSMYPGSSKLTYWFPSFFSVGLIISVLLFLYGIYSNSEFLTIPLILFGLYLLAIFFKTGFYSVIAALVQFFGYGFGFLRSFFRLNILGKPKEQAFPEMFR